MALALPSRQTIFEAILDEISDRLPEANTGEGEPFWVIAQILTTAIWSVFQPVAYVAEQIFPTSADTPFLIRHGAARKIPRKDAAQSVGYALITGANTGPVQAQGTSFQDTGNSTYTSTANAVLTLGVWPPTKIAGFDKKRRDRFIAASTQGMSVGDVFTCGGNTYCIRALPGGASVMIYGIMPFDDPTGYTVTPAVGARVPILADATGSSGNLPYGATLSFSPVAGVDANAYVLELGGGSDIETYAAWGQRIEDVQAEYPAGGNRAQLLAWSLGLSTKEERDADAQKLYALGVDDAFVYPLFRGRGSADICVRGVKGARHLNTARRDAIQNYIAPAVPTDDNPGMIAMGADIRVIDFTDQPQDLYIIITGDAGYAADWSTANVTIQTAAGCTRTRINTTVNPVNIIQPGNRVVITLPSGKLVLARTSSVDAAGFNVTPALDEAPNAGIIIGPGSSLIEPVRDAILAMFENFGPGDTFPRPSRYPAVSNEKPCNLTRALINKTVMSVPGVNNVAIVLPNADVRANPQQQIVVGSLTIGHGT